jgi:hypothetical protein
MGESELDSRAKFLIEKQKVNKSYKPVEEESCCAVGGHSPNCTCHKNYRYGGMVLDTGYDLTLAKNSVGKGWHKLLDAVFAAKPTEVKVVQVKEKFGVLTIYWDGPEPENDDIADVVVDPMVPAPFLSFRPGTPKGYKAFANLVSAAEEVSARICEDCGNPGIRGLSKGRWILTQCQACVDKAKKRA